MQASDKSEVRNPQSFSSRLHACPGCERIALMSRLDICEECSSTVLAAARAVSFVVEKRDHPMEVCYTRTTRLRYYNVMIDRLELLLCYEKKGINVISPSASTLISSMQSKRSQHVLEDLTKILKEADAMSRTATTLRGRIGPAEDFLTKLAEDGELVGNPTEVASLRSQATQIIHRATLGHHLEKAKQVELNGNTKRALERYCQTLDYLRNNDVDDAVESKLIGQLERNIHRLGGTVPGAS